MEEIGSRKMAIRNEDVAAQMTHGEVVTLRPLARRKLESIRSAAQPPDSNMDHWQRECDRHDGMGRDRVR